MKKTTTPLAGAQISIDSHFVIQNAEYLFLLFSRIVNCNDINLICFMRCLPIHRFRSYCSSPILSRSVHIETQKSRILTNNNHVNKAV